MAQQPGPIFDDWQKVSDGYYARPGGYCLGDRYVEAAEIACWVGSDTVRPRAWQWRDRPSALRWVLAAGQANKGCKLWGKEGS